MSSKSTWTICASAVLAAWMFSGCAGPQQETTTPSENPSQAASAPSAEAPKAASNQQVFEPKRTGEEAPAVPEGCEFREDLNNYRLVCGDTKVSLSRIAVPNESANIAEAMLVGITQAWRDSGLNVVEMGKESISVGAKSLDVTRYTASNSSVNLEVAAAAAPSDKTGKLSAFTCTIPTGVSAEAAGCGKYLAHLQDYSYSQRAVGMAIGGQALDIPAECEISDGSLGCGHDVISWQEYPGSTSEETLRGPLRLMTAHFESQNVPIKEFGAQCKFQDAPIDCSGLVFHIPGHRAQATVMAFGTVQDKKILLVCDIVEMQNPIVLPKACAMVFEAEFASGEGGI